MLVRNFRIRTEYGEIRRISPYSVLMRENEEQNNSECGHTIVRKSCILDVYGGPWLHLCDYWILIKRQNCDHIETSQLICSATLVFNELKQKTRML